MAENCERLNSVRLKGAVKFGNTWAIPEGKEKPKDERIKSGEYIKKKISETDDVKDNS